MHQSACDQLTPKELELAENQTSDHISCVAFPTQKQHVSALLYCQISLSLSESKHIETLRIQHHKATHLCSMQRKLEATSASSCRYQLAILPLYCITSGSLTSITRSCEASLDAAGLRKARAPTAGSLNQHPSFDYVDYVSACEHTKAAPSPFILAFGATSKWRK